MNDFLLSCLKCFLIFLNIFILILLVVCVQYIFLFLILLFFVILLVFIFVYCKCIRIFGIFCIWRIIQCDWFFIYIQWLYLRCNGIVNKLLDLLIGSYENVQICIKYKIFVLKLCSDWYIYVQLYVFVKFLNKICN